MPRICTFCHEEIEEKSSYVLRCGEFFHLLGCWELSQRTLIVIRVGEMPEELRKLLE